MTNQLSREKREEGREGKGKEVEGSDIILMDDKFSFVKIHFVLYLFPWNPFSKINIVVFDEFQSHSILLLIPFIRGIESENSAL